MLAANIIRSRLVPCHHSKLPFGKRGHHRNNHSIARVRGRSQLPPETFGLSGEQFGEEFAADLKSASAFVGQFADKLDGAFIKIDVEGMEGEIVGALLDLIAEHKPVVGFEWFSDSQPDLGRIAAGVSGYELWGIRMHDLGRNLLWRSAKLLFTGRSFTLERIDLAKVDKVYPLALMIPEGMLD